MIIRLPQTARLWWLLLLLFSATIWWLSSQSSHPVKLPLFPHADKVVHALVFGLLALTALKAFQLTGGSHLSRLSFPDSSSRLSSRDNALYDKLEKRSQNGSESGMGQWLARYAYPNAWVYTALYGAIDEWHQGHVPGRSMDPYDWFADITGALILLTAAYWMQKHQRPRER